jgi:hypothetical protein
MARESSQNPEVGVARSTTETLANQHGLEIGRASWSRLSGYISCGDVPEGCRISRLLDSHRNMASEPIDYTAFAELAGITPEQARFAAIFMPHAARRQTTVYTEKTRFVHYTNASAAFGILRSREVWMRKVDCMNDVSEVRYGMGRLYDACDPNAFRDRLKAALNAISPTLFDEFAKLWGGWEPHLLGDTYVLCLSEHDASEDILGRLSMWRAYGRDCGVALVVNTEVFRRPGGTFGAITSPVAYFTRDEFMAAFEELVSNIETNIEFLKTFGHSPVMGALFGVFRFAAVGTKHPGFVEEREWRVVYSPKIDQSKYLIRDVVVINGVPQPIYKIPLRDVPDAGLIGAEISALLERIIIGPTDYGSAIIDAFVELLAAAGVPEPEKKIFRSDIPLRSR